MRTKSTLLGLSLLALASTARAEDAAPTTAQPSDGAAAAAPAAGVSTAATAETSQASRKLRVGLSFLPMGLGKYVYRPDGVSPLVKSDAYFAYGVGISASYEVLPHLMVGVAPQAIYNVQEKTPLIYAKAVAQYDVMARVAYYYELAERIEVFAEFLPGYSLLRNSAGSKGLVLAFGAGFSVPVTDRVFVSLSGGYQWGFQKWDHEAQTRFLRGALGAGMKF
jgi:hypothetical protein